MDALLHPNRRPVTRSPDRPFEAVQFEGAGVRLAGWWFHARERRGTVVFLHGVSDNRSAGTGIADHFVPRGFDVIAYDSRAHGMVPGAGHKHVLDAQVWSEVDAWLEMALSSPARRSEAR